MAFSFGGGPLEARRFFPVSLNVCLVFWHKSGAGYIRGIARPLIFVAREGYEWREKRLASVHQTLGAARSQNGPGLDCRAYERNNAITEQRHPGDRQRKPARYDRQ